MTRIRRFALVAVLLAALVAAPSVVSAWPVRPDPVTAARLLQLVQGSASVPFSGYAESTGGLVLPVTTTDLSTLSDLFGGRTDLRAWYRGEAQWRVDTVSAFGESDFAQDTHGSWTWDYEARTATRDEGIVPDAVRLPRTPDLLPPALARRLLSEALPAEATRLPVQRVAGHAVPGIRIVPQESISTITAVDVWADPSTGLPLEVVVRGAGTDVVTSRFLDVSTATPSVADTGFAPPDGVSVSYQSPPDLVGSINAFSRGRPPPSLAGLARADRSLGLNAVGLYGRGATFLAAVPVPFNQVPTLRTQLEKAAGSTTAPEGTQLTVGPLSLLLIEPSLTHGRVWLLTGTVTAAALREAAHQLPIEDFGR